MKGKLSENGYEIIENVYSDKEISELIDLAEKSGVENEFGVRAFLTDHPEIADKVFTKNLKEVIYSISPNCKKSIKSIYFDKPPNANWIVNWHQDLTINVTHKEDVENYKNWRVKKERTIVQPSLDLLESIFTIRIHLDDCKKENGALRVIESSHKRGVIDIKEWMVNKDGKERVCEVKKGGILIMKPLTLHSSKRTENQLSRRVIHIELTDKSLPKGLKWKEEVEF
jgi:hypothetical protein